MSFKKKMKKKFFFLSFKEGRSLVNETQIMGDTQNDREICKILTYIQVL